MKKLNLNIENKTVGLRKGIIKNIEAKVLPWSIAVLMIAVALSSVFVLMPDTIVKADSTYTYTETFEDDTLGDIDDNNHTNPTEDWYWAYEAFDDGNADCYISNAHNATGGKALYIHGGDSDFYKQMFKLYNGTDFVNNSCDYIEWYMLVNTSDDFPTFASYKYWSDSWSNPTGDDVIISVVFNSGTVQVNNGSFQDTSYSIVANVWYKLKIEFNWTTDMAAVYANDSIQGWYGFRNSASGLYTFSIEYTTGTGTTDTGYFNNISLGTDTLLTAQVEKPVASWFNIVDSYLDSGAVTWSGEADTITYSNETAGVGNNVTIETDVNISENCTDAYIDLSGDTAFGAGDQVDFDSSSGNSTMWLQVGTDETWSDEWVQFTDANLYNISLNTSWASLSDDSNPFVINNASGNVTIHCIFKLVLGAGISAATYDTSSTSVWKITWKYETTW